MSNEALGLEACTHEPALLGTDDCGGLVQEDCGGLINTRQAPALLGTEDCGASMRRSAAGGLNMQETPAGPLGQDGDRAGGLQDWDRASSSSHPELNAAVDFCIADVQPKRSTGRTTATGVRSPKGVV